MINTNICPPPLRNCSAITSFSQFLFDVLFNELHVVH